MYSCLCFMFMRNSGCIVYPEGHISKSSNSSSLRTGVMEVAYNLNCACQVILTKGKEDIMNVDSFELQENAHVSVCVSEVLIPRSYGSKEEWFSKLRSVWDSTSRSLCECVDEIEIIAPLPGIVFYCCVDVVVGVNTDLCVAEPISGNAMVYSVSILIVIAGLFYSLYNM